MVDSFMMAATAAMSSLSTSSADLAVFCTLASLSVRACLNADAVYAATKSTTTEPARPTFDIVCAAASTGRAGSRLQDLLHALERNNDGEVNPCIDA